MKKERYGLKADIWSIGIVFYEMIYGKLPYEPMKSIQMYEQIMKKDIFPDGGKINGIRPSKEVLDALKKILTVDHHKRLGWEELISQPIFQNKKELSDEYRLTFNIASLKNRIGEVTERDEEDIMKKVQKVNLNILSK